MMLAACSSDENEIKAPPVSLEPVYAFPTAEGYGQNTIGGRGGNVYEGTNLNDSGEGSLREAVEAEGPRTVVFRISGTIDLQKDLEIKNPYITIAGQTAPGDGICLKRYPLVIATDEVIIRYIRVRLGDETGDETDAITARGVKNIILDHISTSWSIDETLSVYQCENVTIQWCLISESLYYSNHSKGAHGFGAIWGNANSTYHHNLLAHHSSRNPRFTDADNCEYNDYRNNVLYNWAYNSLYGAGNSSMVINMVNNYYKPGPATRPGNTSYRLIDPTYDETTGSCAKWFVEGNIVEGYPEVNENNWNGGVQPDAVDWDLAIERLKRSMAWPALPISCEETAEEAYQNVLANVGAVLPKRDAVDIRIINEVKMGTATYEGTGYKLYGRELADPTIPCGIIDSQEDVGGWPILESTPAPIDSDHDGIPDEWEIANGLNPNDPEDGKKFAANRYTNLENYLNSLCGEYPAKSNNR